MPEQKRAIHSRSLLDMPPECLKLVVEYVDRPQLLYTNQVIRDILSLSHTCRYLKEVINEDYWKSWCFARRIGRCDSSWLETVLALNLLFWEPCKSEYTHALSATDITSRRLELRPSEPLRTRPIIWRTPWTKFTHAKDVSWGPNKACTFPKVAGHSFATEPPSQGLVVRFDEYIPQLPGLDHLYVANSDGVTVGDVLIGIERWMSTPLSASQKAHLYAHYSDSTVEAEVVDLLIEASEGAQDTQEQVSNTMRRAKREAFMAAHEYRYDLATLPSAGLAPMKPGSVCLSVLWHTHKRGDAWMPTSEAPAFERESLHVIKYRSWDPSLDGKPQIGDETYDDEKVVSVG